MGHRRTGTLPKTSRWSELVADVHSFTGDEHEISSVVSRTLQNVRQRFLALESDPSVHSSFRFLLGLAIAAPSPDPAQRFREFGIEPPDGDTPLSLAKALNTIIQDSAGPAEYASLSRGATCDALTAWVEQSDRLAPRLFHHDVPPFDIWREASTGSGFCELARMYFAGFTERYLKYFLEREASRGIRTLHERDEFDRQLGAHVDRISRFAFETAKITQSFAAGWFNKNAREGMPNDDRIRRFLSFSFRKLREELGREADE